MHRPECRPQKHTKETIRERMHSSVEPSVYDRKDVKEENGGGGPERRAGDIVGHMETIDLRKEK